MDRRGTGRDERPHGPRRARSGPRRPAPAPLRGPPAHAHPAPDRALHGAPRGRRAVPVLGGAGGSGRSQPAVRDPFAVALGSRRAIRRCASTCARSPPPAADGGHRGQRVPAGRRGRDRQSAPPGGAARRPVAVERAGRLLAASRPLPVLGLRAAASQAYGFSYFAAKVHPDVRLLDEAARCSPTGSTRPCARARRRCSASRSPAIRGRSSSALAYAKEAGLMPSSPSPTPPSRRSPSTPTSCCRRPCRHGLAFEHGVRADAAGPGAPGGDVRRAAAGAGAAGGVRRAGGRARPLRGVGQRSSPCLRERELRGDRRTVTGAGRRRSPRGRPPGSGGRHVWASVEVREPLGGP